MSARRNSDETIRDLERKAAEGDRAALERLGAARLRTGVSVASRIGELLDQQIEPRPGMDARIVREHDLVTIARVVAWVLSAPAPPESFEGRPWAWDELSSGSVLAVRHRDGVVTIGIHGPNEASDWTRRWHRSIEDMASRGPPDEDPATFREAAYRLPPPYHPGTSWPDLAWPEGYSAAGTLFWDRHTKHSYSWHDLTPVIARWSDRSTPEPDRIHLAETEARWLVREIFYGVDISSHEELMRALTEPVTRNRLAHLVSQVGLMQGVMPPVEQGLQPENATGTGWADWAARRLVQILSARRVGGKDLTVIPRRALEIEDQGYEMRRRRGLESMERISTAHVLVYPKGAVSMTGRERRAAWERVQDKSIEVSINFPLDMQSPQPYGWAGRGVDAVTPDGLFFIATGHGRFGRAYGDSERDQAPYGLQGLAKVVEDAIANFFPGATVRAYWHWWGI